MTIKELTFTDYFQNDDWDFDNIICTATMFEDVNQQTQGNLSMTNPIAVCSRGTLGSVATRIKHHDTPSISVLAGVGTVERTFKHATGDTGLVIL